MDALVFDHPFLSGLLGDEEAARHFGADADIAAMLRFEVALAAAEGAAGAIPGEAAPAIAAAAVDFRPDMNRLRSATAKDGVVVPELVRQLRSAVAAPYREHVHFGATSQDVIDTSLALRLGEVLDVLAGRLERLIAALDALMIRDGPTMVMAHTRMQAAVPVPASRKIASWQGPLKRHRERLSATREEIAVLSFGGAAGTLDRLGDKGRAVTLDLAARLGLSAPDHARHSERDGIASLSSLLSLITGSLGKFGADISLAARTEIGEVRLASGGASSAMPHKVNPVGAEILVALARFNAALLSSVHQSLVHENERSGAAWTLEWMLVPQMAVAAARSLNAALDLLGGMAISGLLPSRR